MKIELNVMLELSDDKAVSGVLNELLAYADRHDNTRVCYAMLRTDRDRDTEERVTRALKNLSRVPKEIFRKDLGREIKWN